MGQKMQEIGRRSQLFANQKNEEEKVSGVGSSVEALGVKHLKEMEEIARKGGDEYQLEKVLQENLDKRARDCQEEAEKELLRFAAHLIR